MNDLARTMVVLLPLTAISLIAYPHIMTKRKQIRVVKKFSAALAKYDTIGFEGEGKNGKLPWGKKASSLATSELPAIRVGIFIMRPTHDVYVMSDQPARRPASIDPSFFQLDDSVRATSPSEIRTVVHVTVSMTKFHYAAKPGAATLAIMVQMVATLQIYDLEDKVLLGTWHLQGSSPPGKIQTLEMPEVPGPLIAEFLMALPRR